MCLELALHRDYAGGFYSSSLKGVNELKPLVFMEAQPWSKKEYRIDPGR